jgi:3-mercaptopyruvate sulfurtransferase SseA
MRYLIPFTFIVALIISIACAQRVDQNLTASNSAASTPTPSPRASSTPTPSEDAPRITLEEAKKAYDEGKAFIVDARAEEAFKAEHIKSAVNIRQDTLDKHLKELPRDKTIIVYCS